MQEIRTRWSASGLGMRFLSAAVGIALLCAPGRAAVPQKVTLDDLLKRARQVIQRYGEEAALLLAEETCSQTLFSSKLEAGKVPQGFQGPVMQRIDPKEHRTWQAEIALVRTPERAGAGYPWMEFRDVVKVDGQGLPDRADRLARLFLKQPEWTIERAREIYQEGARYNIGPVSRSVNTPAVPLLVLHPANDGRFAFTKDGEETIGGIRAWKVAYRERRKPYLVGGDSPDACAANGTLWLDAATGEVMRAMLQCKGEGGAVSKITVSYSTDERWHLRLPAEMIEKAESTVYGSWVDGKYTYSNFRRFETSGRLIVPK